MIKFRLTESALMVVTLLGLCFCMPSSARALPTTSHESTFGVGLVRNLDEFEAHWGVNAGYCWRGRVDARLEWREDGMLGKDILVFQGEIALLKRRGFILESGYHRTLTSKYRRRYNLVPVRISFPVEVGGRLHIVPNFTYWRILADFSDAIGFAALDFQWDQRFAFGAELNVNQDFRYHNVDVRFTYLW